MALSYVPFLYGVLWILFLCGFCAKNGNILATVFLVLQIYQISVKKVWFLSQKCHFRDFLKSEK